VSNCDPQAAKHLSIPDREPQLSYVVLPDGTSTVRCACGWQLPPLPPSPFDPTEALVAAQGEHRSCPGPRPATPTDLVDRAIAAIRDLNDRFLPAHTREHALAALDLLRVVREELAEPDVDEAPCRKTS
jgi:hypothetical protein